MKTIDIIIKYINDKTSTYKILREYTPLSLSEIKSRIENHDAVITVNDLKLDELKKVREIIRSLNDIGTEVVIQDVTGTITLKILENIISSYEGIAADAEKLDALMFSEDIIIKHMWGLTIAPPRYKEAYIVTLVDKYWAIKEATSPWRQKLRNRKLFHRKMLKN